MAHSENSWENGSSLFNVNLFLDSFAKCSAAENGLCLELYLVGFKELYKFFGILGSVFGFVASDVISKVNILEEYRGSEHSEHYATVQSMIDYENINGLADNKAKPSGCRTLLRLHRSLEFIIKFMREMSKAEIDANSSVIARKCYKESLSRYHPWLIQQGAYIAMYSLPVKHQFMQKVFNEPGKENFANHCEKLMMDIADVSNSVYEQTQKLYESVNLLNLP